MTEFKLEKEYIELFKLLKYLGVSESGGAAKGAIDEGLVKVDGKVELRRRCKIRLGQTVECNDQSIKVI